MTYSSVYGQFLSRGQVEQKVLDLLRSPPFPGLTAPLMVYYLAEVERQQAMQPRSIPVPPADASYRGGLDFETFEGDQLPVVIATAQPIGESERYYSGQYQQWYEVHVGAVVEARDEDSTRLLADLYGAALMGALMQHGGLGTRSDVPFAEKTVLWSTPRTEFLEGSTATVLARSVLTVRTLVEQVVNELGPTTFPPDPYTIPAGWGTVTEVDIKLQSQTPAGDTSPATGVSVLTPDHGVVVEE